MLDIEFKEIMKGESNISDIDDCNVFLGLQIIRKYIPKAGVEGAEHDIIYSAVIYDLIEAGITREDAEELCRLNWFIDEDTMACYV
jgi:hypothetical protein